MYIKRIIDRNIGPISKIDISMSFTENADPKPLIIVGENGSGKSTLISNIVDSFYEFAGKKYGNALHKSDEGNGYVYYKNISGLQIKAGEKYLFSRVFFENNVDYLFKAGNCSFEQFKEESLYEGVIPDWEDNPNRKLIQGLATKEIEKLFSEQVFCYFGPERYEKPNWLGKAYYDDLNTHLNVEPKVFGRLSNPITAYNMGKENLRWLLDVIVDSRTDVESKGEELISIHVTIENLMKMTQARNNVEMVMSTILGEDVYFGLNLRKAEGARFNIRRKNDNSIIVPTLDALSSGQLALFNIFSTIIRYADNIDINKSIHPDQIKGIVVIDEIELHLHSIHQKEILPHLMKLFPRVQFIVTTHSPLFLLGLKDEYGENGFDIYQMPAGNKISAEMFCEFNKAYEYFAKTEKHHAELRDAIDKHATENPLIITEGSTDWKHMLAAFNDLSNRDENKELFDGLCFDFFRYEPANSTIDAEFKTEMGKDALVAMCDSYSKIPQSRKLIFIADCDDKKTNNRMSVQGKPFKEWGNNVYSFTLPVPELRKDTPEICIEHLYSDDEIKTETLENNILRRLYMGYEFNTNGISKDLGKMCENKHKCGPDKIAIIEGSSGEKVIDPFSDNDVNYALSKTKFAEYVLTKKPGFEAFDFSNFLGIFEIIKQIINAENSTLK